MLIERETRMPFKQSELTAARLSQQQRSQSFASRTADRIRAEEHCLFSLLPSDELARLAAGWHEACSQAMLRGNYAPIDKWIRSQSAMAAAEGFSQDDVLHLLRICRGSAFEIEGWNKDVFSEVEEVIKEAVWDTSGWHVPSEMDAEIQVPELPESAFVELEPDDAAGERRIFGRSRLRLPIRVRSVGGQWQAEEINVTRSISRGGLEFVTLGNYFADQILKVCYPYWTDPGAINRDYSAKVVRLTRLSDRDWAVAIHFLESLGQRSL